MLTSFVLGTLVGSIGPLLLAWDFFLDEDPQWIGLHFAAFGGGYALATCVRLRSVPKSNRSYLAITACSLIISGLISLPFSLRILGLTLMGAGAGLLVKVLLNGLHAGELTRGLIRRCDTLLRAGCIVSAVIVWLCCEADVSSQSPFVLALGPLVLVALISIRQPVFESATPLSRYQREQRRLRSILLTLLVFFQSGGEWILAGWLPYWAMRSFGTSTTVAILMIPAFFAAQLLSRLAFERFLQKLIGRRLLVGACVVSASGLLVLTASASSAAAYVGTLLAGSGLGAAYPSLSKTFDDRFTFDAPLYTALLLSGILGAMMFAWLFAYLDRWLGLSALPLLPMAGVTSVLVLGFLAMLERRLMGESTTLSDTSAS